MSITLRLILIAGSIVAFIFVVNRIHYNKILIGDSIFWVLLSLALILLAVFQGVSFFFSTLLGFISPSNFVFLLVIVLLLTKVFSNASEISMLKHRVNELAQENALLEKMVRDEINHKDKASHF